jgi:hypothetical protein
MQTVSSMNEQPGYSIVLNQFITKKRLCTLYGTVVASMRSMRSSMGGSNKKHASPVGRRGYGYGRGYTAVRTRDGFSSPSTPSVRRVCVLDGLQYTTLYGTHAAYGRAVWAMG